MRLSELFSTPPIHDAGPRPSDSELDLFGLTPPGCVRKENQAHFLLCTVHPQVVIHGTSLPHPEQLPQRGQRLATIILVADGVGGSVAGGQASRVATEAITRYVSSTLRCYHAAGTTKDEEFLDALRSAALGAHEAVRADADDHLQGGVGATTMTLGIVVWPLLYVVQVGDSRCYYFSKGELRQVTRDQTIAQDLVDRGVMPAERASGSPLSHVLSSAIGGPAAVPEVTRVDIQRGCIILACSDGLTKHVSDAEIKAHLVDLRSSEQVCRALVELALARGGTDNITVVVGRARTGPPTE